MPFWQRPSTALPPPPSEEPEPALSAPPVIVGDKACSRRGCDRSDGACCAYVDRRHRACQTGWCPDHQTVVGEKPYCPRHATTLAALAADVPAGGLPELENRVPSLVQWVANDLDDDVRNLLRSFVESYPGSQVIGDPVHLITGGGRLGARRWERNWKLIDHTGIALKVTIVVAEAGEVQVDLRVGPDTVASAVPPWIAERLQGRELSAEEDGRRRRAYYLDLHNAVAKGLQREASAQADSQGSFGVWTTSADSKGEAAG